MGVLYVYFCCLSGFYGHACLPYCVSAHALPIMCVYMSTCMNAYMQAREWTFGLRVTDPVAGVNMCVRACRHGRSNAAMTPTFPIGFLHPPALCQWLFIFLFSLFPLFLTVDQTGNASLIRKISEVSASCWRNVWRCKKVRRYTPLLCLF